MASGAVPAPAPGQLWLDNDKRLHAPRFVRVDELLFGRSLALVTTWYDEPNGPEAARTSRIAVHRFRDNSSGYRPTDLTPKYGSPA